MNPYDIQEAIINLTQSINHLTNVILDIRNQIKELQQSEDK